MMSIIGGQTDYPDTEFMLASSGTPKLSNTGKYSYGTSSLKSTHYTNVNYNAVNPRIKNYQSKYRGNAYKMLDKSHKYTLN